MLIPIHAFSYYLMLKKYHHVIGADGIPTIYPPKADIIWRRLQYRTSHKPTELPDIYTHQIRIPYADAHLIDGAATAIYLFEEDKEHIYGFVDGNLLTHQVGAHGFINLYFRIYDIDHAEVNVESFQRGYRRHKKLNKARIPYGAKLYSKSKSKQHEYDRPEVLATDSDIEYITSIFVRDHFDSFWLDNWIDKQRILQTKIYLRYNVLQQSQRSIGEQIGHSQSRVSIMMSPKSLTWLYASDLRDELDDLVQDVCTRYADEDEKEDIVVSLQGKELTLF